MLDMRKGERKQGEERKTTKKDKQTHNVYNKWEQNTSLQLDQHHEYRPPTPGGDEDKDDWEKERESSKPAHLIMSPRN
jgi:hypothetical protein